jgi:hypothetical protein
MPNRLIISMILPLALWGAPEWLLIRTVDGTAVEGQSQLSSVKVESEGKTAELKLTRVLSINNAAPASEFEAGRITAGLAAIQATDRKARDQAVVELPIGLDRVTTVNFPRPIQSLDGASLTADGRTPGQFQVAQSAGNSSLALRALKAGASANLNVRLADHTYVFLLNESKNPVLAVNFLGAPATATVAGGDDDRG